MVFIPAQIRKQLFAKRWIDYAKQPFYGPKQVIEYLGRYSHKVALSNHRIKCVKDGKVNFSAKDYRNEGRKMAIVLSEKEFIRRFALHILPKGFTRIRHYGILSSSTKVEYKTQIDKQMGRVQVVQKTPSVHRICPTCRKGRL